MELITTVGLGVICTILPFVCQRISQWTTERNARQERQLRVVNEETFVSPRISQWTTERNARQERQLRVVNEEIKQLERDCKRKRNVWRASVGLTGFSMVLDGALACVFIPPLVTVFAGTANTAQYKDMIAAQKRLEAKCQERAALLRG